MGNLWTAFHKRRWWFLLLGGVLMASGVIAILRGTWAAGLAVATMALLPLTLSAFGFLEEMRPG